MKTRRCKRIPACDRKFFFREGENPIQVKRNVVIYFKLFLAHIIFLSYLCLLVFDWLLSFLRRTRRHLAGTGSRVGTIFTYFYPSLLNRVLGVLVCLRALRVYVLVCSCAWRVYLLACLRACVLGLRAYLLTCLACLHACVLACVRVYISVHRKGFS